MNNPLLSSTSSMERKDTVHHLPMEDGMPASFGKKQARLSGEVNPRYSGEVTEDRNGLAVSFDPKKDDR